MKPFPANHPLREVGTSSGSARASRAVFGALAENSLHSDGSIVFALIFPGSALKPARRGLGAVHARRVRSSII